MAKIRPFQAIRPDSYEVDKVASLPYCVMNSNNNQKLEQSNEKSFLHIEQAKIALTEEKQISAAEMERKRRKKFDHFLEKGWLMKDQESAFYIYGLRKAGNLQLGLVMTVAVEEFLSGNVKCSELPLYEIEQDSFNRIESLDAHSRPLLLAYRENAEITQLIQTIIRQKLPIYAFESSDDTEHFVWKVNNPKMIAQITAIFEKDVSQLYTAEDSHRLRAAVRFAEQKRKAHPEIPEKANFNYILSAVFPDTQVGLVPCHHIVQDALLRLDWEKIQEIFIIEEAEEDDFPAENSGTIGMYAGGKWYSLSAKPDGTASPLAKPLDLSSLQKHILGPVFDITEPSRDPRISYVRGNHSVQELMQKTDQSEEAVAFFLHPPTWEALLAAADEEEYLPHRSVSFDPVLLNGLFLYDLESSRHEEAGLNFAAEEVEFSASK